MDYTQQKRQYQSLSFFDQMPTMEIDLSAYLKNMSSDDFTYEFSNIQPAVCTIKNLFEQYKIIAEYKKNSSAFIRYNIKDGERIENISFRFYETVDFWWLIAIFNDIKNPFFDLPLQEQQVIELAARLTTEEGKYPEQIYYKLIFEANEKRRKIYVPKREFISEIVWEFRKAIMNYSR